MTMVQCRQLEDCESSKKNKTPDGRGRDSEHDGETHRMADQRNQCLRRAKPDLSRLQANMHLEEELTAMEVAKQIVNVNVNGQQIEEGV